MTGIRLMLRNAQHKVKKWWENSNPAGYMHVDFHHDADDGRHDDMTVSTVSTIWEPAPGEYFDSPRPIESIVVKDDNVGGSVEECPSDEIVVGDAGVEKTTAVVVFVSEPEKKLGLLDLPEEILVTICGEFLNVHENAVVACTSRQCNALASGPATVRYLSLANIQQLQYLDEKYPVRSLIRRLLPMAVAGNLEALLCLARITLYAKGDLKTGTSLLLKGARLGDSEAKYELSVLLQQCLPGSVGYKMRQQFLQEANDSGCCVARLEMRKNQDGKAAYSNLRDAAGAEMAAVSGVYRLTEPDVGPRTRHSCQNIYCFRTSHKWNTSDNDEDWQNIRENVSACGARDMTKVETSILAEVGLSLKYCGGCAKQGFCSEACFHVEWKYHKRVCSRRHERRQRQRRQG